MKQTPKHIAQPLMRRRRRRQSDRTLTSPSSDLGQSQQANVPLNAKNLEHPTARPLRQSTLAGMQRTQGNRSSIQHLAHAGKISPGSVQSPQSAGLIARKLPAVDANRELTPETKALVERYWKRRGEDPAWVTEFHKLVDRMFWKETSYKVGEPLNPKLAEDQPYCEIWLQTRDKLMAEFKGDPISDVLVLLRYSESLLERNTAENVDTGKLKAFYMEDCAIDPNSDALLTSWGHSKALYVVMLHPDTNEQMIVDKQAVGFRSGNGIFTKRSQSMASVKATLIHETNHALQPSSIGDASSKSFERYKDEFQAYWVDPDYSGEADQDKRAANIKAHILSDYDDLKASYDTEAAFKAKVDAHNRPSGNLINSARWAAIEQAAETAPTDEEAILNNILAMPDAERAFVRSDVNFMSLLEKNLSPVALRTSKEALNK